MIVFWSGDPDQTQHAQGDSLNQFVAGHQRPHFERGDPERRSQPEADSRLSRRESRGARQHERLRDGRSRILHGQPPGNRCVRPCDDELLRDAAVQRCSRTAGSERRLAAAGISRDRSGACTRPALYDPEAQTTDARGVRRYAKVDPTIGQQTAAMRQRPSGSSALIGGTGKIARPTDAKVVVAQTSIHVPDNDRRMVQRIVRFLAAQDYVGGIFVNDRFGEMPGALQ